MNTNDLSGKVAVVTGGARGIGEGISRVLASYGASVVIGERSIGYAARIVGDIAESGIGSATVRQLDVTSNTSVLDMVEKTIQQFGHIDILVNNAGVVAAPDWHNRREDLEEDTELIHETNVRGTERVTNAILPYMQKQQYGRIVNISSIAGLKANRAHVPVAYSASKAALIQMTKIWALSNARYDITANAVCPGLVWTAMWEKIGKRLLNLHTESDSAWRTAHDVFNQQVEERIPLRKPQSPEDIGQLVAFLVSPHAWFITGAYIPADGGAHL